MRTKESPSPFAVPIDVWFAEQDRAVDAELKIVKRKRRRRKLDKDEMERRIAERMAHEQESLAVQLAIARTVYKRFTWSTVGDPNHRFKDELVQGLNRAMPGTSFNDRVPLAERACWTEPDPISHEDGETRSKHYWAVRAEVVREMEAEQEKRHKA